MEKQLSHEQLDKLMQKLLNDAAADEATISEVANSRAVWFGVQRQINEQKAATLSVWPPIGKVLRWLMVGVPVAAAAALIISFFVFRPVGPNDNNNIVSSVIKPVRTEVINTPSEAPRTGSTAIMPKAVENPAKSPKRQVLMAKIPRDVRHASVRPELTNATTTKKSGEIKTEFIALSYARDPESGQIVRVKVPSSMMVSLGLVVSVEKPSDLVDAEVLVGDDGLTRAIRFIR